MRAGQPLVVLGPGAVSDPRGLLRFLPDDAEGVVASVGPVEAGSRRPRTGRPRIHAAGVGGVDHDDVESVGPDAVGEILSWAVTRGVGVSLALRGTVTGELAGVVTQIRRGVDAGALAAVEVDLRGADDQRVLKTMARVREAAPRDLPLHARLHTGAPDLVGCARAAVAGGAGAVVVSGQVRLGDRRWWSGPSTLAGTLAGLRQLQEAAAEQRWPGARLVAAGGVHGEESARQAVRAGARTVQLGTALWADPTLVGRVRDAVAAALDDQGNDGHTLDRAAARAHTDPHTSPRRIP